MRAGKNNQSLGRQRGVALFIALVVLLIITVIGVAGLQTSRMEERMATSSRDHDIAFQAAEAALRAAEQTVQALPANFVGQFDANTAGKFRPAAVADAPRWETVDWLGDPLEVAAASDIGTVARRPKYIIEYMAQVAFAADANNQGGYGEGEPELSDIFRITANGTGGSSDARVLLQSTYGKLAQ